GGGDCASVEDDDFGGGRVVRSGKTQIAELAFEGGAIGLGGAATELVGVKGRHFSVKTVYLTQDACNFEVGKARIGNRTPLPTGWLYSFEGGRLQSLVN